MKIAVVCICKNEEYYINEWINHYLYLGFDDIFILDNNDVNNDLMKNIIISKNNNHIKYIDVRGLKYCQNNVYNDIYKNERLNYDWIAFFDCDEFLEFKNKNENIKSFLDNDKFKNADQIRFCWQIYNDNNLLDVINENYSINRFTKHLDKTHPKQTQCKSIINTKYIGKIYTHGIYNKDVISLDSNGNKCRGISCHIGNEQILGNAWLNHYRTKTIGEYIKFKMFRGDVSSKRFSEKYNDLKEFFIDNEWTKEKEDYANKLIKKLYNDKFFNNSL